MATENPYQSPVSYPTQFSAGQTASDGLWRDGKLLVMRNQNPRFPPRCVKTNQPCTGPPTRIKLTWLENDTMWVLLLGVLGRAFVMVTQGKKIWVELPLSQGWLAGRRRAGFIGWGLVGGGVAALIAGIIACASSANGNAEPPIGCLILLFGGLLAALVGLFWLVIFQQPPITAKEITNGLAWIKGVHPDFLQSLPEWPWREGARKS